MRSDHIDDDDDDDDVSSLYINLITEGIYQSNTNNLT